MYTPVVAAARFCASPCPQLPRRHYPSDLPSRTPHNFELTLSLSKILIQTYSLDSHSWLPMTILSTLIKHKFFIVGTHIMPYGCSQTLHKTALDLELSPLKIIQIAEDLNCGGNSPQEVFANWQKVRSALGWCIVHCLSYLHCFLQLEWSKDVLHHISW